MNLLVSFIVWNIINVIIQTVKSIATIKCGKTVASIVNAVAYGLYTYIVVLTMCELPLMWKCLIVALANFVGVWVVKYFEEKARKDKMWKVEVAIPIIDTVEFHHLLTVPHNYMQVGSWTMFNCYCDTQADTKAVTELAKQYGGKVSAYETKMSL